MQRMKIMLLGVLAMLALSSVVSATASAELQGGPWFRHPEAGKQVKWPMNEEKEIKGVNQGGFILKSAIGEKTKTPITLECKEAKITGNIWNGLHQGEDESEVKFTSCTVISSPCAGEAVTVEPAKVFSELMWNHAKESKELKEVGQQKIYDAFAPTVEPNAEGKASFTTIKIPAKCVLGGSVKVEAEGSLAKFIDQHQVEHKIVWGTAAETAPQNQDASVGYLIWRTPNETKLHHQEKEVEAKLFLGTNAAELEGYLKVERNVAEEFGVYNE